MGIQNKILIVDDEREALENCRRILSRLRYECLTEEDPVRALAVLEQERPGLILTDLRMPGIDGIEVLSAAKRVDPDVQVVLMTAYATVQTAVASMRDGAFDYLPKPFSSAELEDVARRAFSGPRKTVENRPEPFPAADRESGKATVGRRYHDRIIGHSPAMQEVLALMKKIAPTGANVLIYGESGTGKELFARAIHELSPRGHRPFIPVDCVSLSDTLLESELFGHEKGAFTGAHASKPGLFEMAHGGTVFLDEVSGMSPSLQSRLLRVLQERQVRPVGGTRFLDLDVRIVAASNQDLEEACRRGSFRQDLYYRLNVISLALPPLRARDGDIELMAGEFLQRCMSQHETAIGAKPYFDPTTLQLLTRYAWPGNVRELLNVIERAAALADGPVIHSDHLPERIRLSASGMIPVNGLGPFKAAKQRLVRSFERNFLVELLKRHDGHMSRAAREAGVDRKTMERMVKKHGLRGMF
ncbi:MAG TPA: sigma-54 dependent transcriptional regulator [Nitrospiraceae bacterium]|nr:sigma-54 dependent transcriptional regulator [Nitrospiraceae bacterium]